MSCVNVQLIDPDECIGASLPKINGNFAALSAAVCELSASTPFNVVDSPTVDLTWDASTRTLSATTTSSVATSSSPMVAKAWVNFNGSGAIRSSYNVSSVTINGSGDYNVNFTSPMADVNYSINGIAGNSASFYDDARINLVVVGYSISSSRVLSWRESGAGGSPISPLFINVTVFGN